MKILYIEDETSKAKDIENYLVKNITKCKIKIRNSYMDGIIQMQKEKFDLILLDMSLPLNNYQIEYTEDFETFAGIDIMEEMIRTCNYTKVIVITAFDKLGEDENTISIVELNQKLKKDFSEIYLGIIHYDSCSLEWKTHLINLLQKIKDI